MLNRFLLSSLVVLLIISNSSAGIIEGNVYDADSSEPIAAVSIRVEGKGRSMATNDDGRYRLRLDPGQYSLRFSHIAHYSETIEVTLSDSTIIKDIKLKPSMIILKGIKAYTRAYDPAQKIILEAVKRKEEILNKIKSYSFDAYARIVVRNRSKDSANILMIVESQNQSNWESPNKYKEIIIARKQTANINASDAILGIGQLMNFNQNRLEFGDNLVVWPTARDALNYYNYYLLDTLYIDKKPIFHLEIEPKNDISPLFVGTIDIADSTYEIVGVDVGFNKAFDMPMIDSLTYSQRYAEFENNFWMPIEIRLEGNANIPFPGIPRLSFKYIGTPHDYSFNLVHDKNTFDEYAFEVDKNADDFDSTQWLAGQIVPLTIEEQNGYKRIDSLENAPKPLWKKALLFPLGVIAIATFAEDIFHYNRVEGAYLGGYLNKKDIFRGLDIDLKTGWAFQGKLWQHDYGFTYNLTEKRRENLSFGYHKKIVHRPTIIGGPDYNPTFMALVDKLDPFDYYLEEGINLNLWTRLLNKGEFEIGYKDYLQSSVNNTTEYSFFRGNVKNRQNPPVSDGHLKALTAKLSWDTRPLMKNKNKISRVDMASFTKLTAGFEYAGPDFLKNDFHYKRYYVSFYHSRRIFNLGQTSIFLYGGLSDLNLPSQGQFIVDYSGTIFSQPMAFKTLGENNFGGTKAGVIYVDHDFGANLFRLSGLPLIKKIPFSLGLHGGGFWTKSESSSIVENIAGYSQADNGYYEFGFSIGKITPLRYRIYFTWQLSGYSTEKFTIAIGSGLF